MRILRTSLAAAAAVLLSTVSTPADPKAVNLRIK
jgi:hypothetical protein